MAGLKGRVALVTGGSRGIGRAIAISLAEAGAAVAVNYLSKAGEATAVFEAIHKLGGRAISVGADVSVAAAVKGMVAGVERELGPIDILINNAGIAINRPVEELTEEDFDLTMAVNLKSVFLCTQAVLPGMRKRRWGRGGSPPARSGTPSAGPGPARNSSPASAPSPPWPSRSPGKTRATGRSRRPPASAETA